MQAKHGYRTTRTLLAMAGTVWLAAGLAAHATGYAWNSTSAGNWSDTTKWTPAGYPATVADTAVFSQNLGANPTIALDVPATVGGLTLVDTTAGNGWVISGSNTLTLAGAAAVSATGSSVMPYSINPHTISAPLAAAVRVSITTGANGGLVLSGSNTALAGGLTISGNGAAQGYVRFDSAASLGAAAAPVTVNTGAHAAIAFAGLTLADLARFASSSGLVSFGNPNGMGAIYSPPANMNLAGYNEYFRLGAFDLNVFGGGATVSGTFTPPSNTYRFGGGGGKLVVTTALTDGTGVRGLEISGAEVIVWNRPSMVCLTAADTYTGATEIRNGCFLRLNGTNGSALNTSGFTVRYGAGLQLDAGLNIYGWGDETGAVVGNSSNRIADTTPVNLHGGSLYFFGNPATGTTETIGNLNVNSGVARLDARWQTGIVDYETGSNILNTRGSGTGAAVLTAQSLSLNNGAHLWLRGVNVGAAGASASRVMLNTAPTTVGGAGAGGSTTISILPGVFHTAGVNVALPPTSGGDNWVMYDGTNGLRGLVAGEYSTLSSGENSNNNTVYQQTGTGSTLSLAATTVNSVKFQFDTGSGTMAIGGTGPLTVKSGNVMIEGNPGDGSTFALNVPLDFNGRQGNIIGMIDTFLAYQVNSVMSNTGGNGVAFTAFNTASIYHPTISIGGSSTYTGPTTINAGLWQTSGNERIPDGSDLRIRAGAKLTVGSGNTETVAGLAGAGILEFGGATSKLVVGSGTATNQAVVVGGGASTGAVTPGDSAGTLTIGSSTQNVNLVAGANAIFNFELGLADVVGMGVNDLIAVNGSLILDGTLNITALPGFGPAPGKGWGTYTLFTYTGSLTDNILNIGTAPTGYGYVFNAGGGVVNLVVPEPVSGLLLGLVAAGCLLQRRRNGR